MKYTLLTCLLLLSNIVLAEPFAKADDVAGKALVTINCVACHDESHGNDGSKIYTRDNRKVTSSQGLAAQVRNCNTMLGLKWFEDEEANVAKYLNKTYYKFTN